MKLPDLDGTPWRAIVLSEKQEVWCLVDAIDYPWLIETNWNVWHAGREALRWQLYAKRNVGADRATVRMHREILRIADPRPDTAQLHGDHSNGQTLDNRRANLRWLTPAENRANIHVRAQIPSLELIVLRLLHQARPARETMMQLATF